MSDTFDVFISYRRSDALAFARRLRRLLQEYKPPRPLRDRRREKLKVYLDTIYEQGTNDFFEKVTLPALLASKHLVVVLTKDAVDRGPGVNDWIRREIEAFEAGPNAGNVIAVRAADVPGNALPGDLARRYPNLEIIDLLGLGAFAFLSPMKGARLSAEMVKLIAPLMGFGNNDMPVLHREEERRQQARLGLASGSATSIIVAIAGLAVFALESRNRAVDALSRSIFATDRMIESVSTSLPAGEGRSNLLASSCDLLDSLRDRAPAPPRTTAIALCAVGRAESRDKVGETQEASATLDAVINLAKQKFAQVESPDNASSELIVRRAMLERAIDGKVPAKQALADFIVASRSRSNALSTDADLPRYAADTLQVAAVRFVEKNLGSEALQAVDQSIEFGKLALERGAPLSTKLEHVAVVTLKSVIHNWRGEASASAQAKEKAVELFASISAQEAASAGLSARYREIVDLVKPPVTKAPTATTPSSKSSTTKAKP